MNTKRARLDLNAASAEELDSIAQLRGHGFEIVRYSQERGRFTSVRELDEVPGLAQKTSGLEKVLKVS